jgi:hypothetical protein
MKRILSVMSVVFCFATHSAAIASSAFDMPAKIFKRPIDGIVNVRKWGNASSQIVGIVSNGQFVRILNGSCVNARTGAEVDITIYKTRNSLYRKLKSPNIFCQVTTPNVDGWVRGTHLMPEGGFE